MKRKVILVRLGACAAVLAGLGVLVAVLLPSRWAANETAAIAALRTYLGAQNQVSRTEFYGAHKGKTTPATLAELARLGFIDKAMAEATSPERSYQGYYFVEIEPLAKIDFSIDFGLCAVPARYPRTGRNTFVIDVTGVVYQKDTGGKPVIRIEEVISEEAGIEDGWTPVGSD